MEEEDASERTRVRCEERLSREKGSIDYSISIREKPGLRFSFLSCISYEYNPSFGQVCSARAEVSSAEQDLPSSHPLHMFSRTSASTSIHAVDFFHVVKGIVLLKA